MYLDNNRIFVILTLYGIRVNMNEDSRCDGNADFQLQFKSFNKSSALTVDCQAGL